MFVFLIGTLAPMKFLSLIFLLHLPLLAEESMRIWTSREGREIEGRFVEGRGDSVTIKRKDGKQIEIPLKFLGQSDVKFVQEKLAQGKAEVNRQAGLKSGPYAKHLTGKWEKMTAADGLRFHFYAGKKLKARNEYPLCIYLHGASNTGSGLSKREPKVRVIRA